MFYLYEVATSHQCVEVGGWIFFLFYCKIQAGQVKFCQNAGLILSYSFVYKTHFATKIGL